MRLSTVAKLMKRAGLYFEPFTKLSYNDRWYASNKPYPANSYPDIVFWLDRDDTRVVREWYCRNEHAIDIKTNTLHDAIRTLTGGERNMTIAGKNLTVFKRWGDDARFHYLVKLDEVVLEETPTLSSLAEAAYLDPFGPVWSILHDFVLEQVETCSSQTP